MVMYGIYSSDTLEQLIDTVHKMHYQTTWNKRLFGSKINYWYGWNLCKDGVGHYEISSLLFVTTAREKYVRIYRKFISQLRMYAKVIRIPSKDYIPFSLLLPSKLHNIMGEVKQAFQAMNPDYDIVIKQLYLYYDMKLVTFGIDENRNLIVQFPILCNLMCNSS